MRDFTVPFGATDDFRNLRQRQVLKKMQNQNFAMMDGRFDSTP